MVVLVVDDAAFMRMVLRKTLESMGVDVIEASNGLEAVTMIKGGTRPDLVTMDITMPEMNGIDALKEIKDIRPDLDVIMVSAMGQQSMVLDSVKAGCSDFIVKPFVDEKIRETFQRHLAGVGKK